MSQWLGGGTFHQELLLDYFEKVQKVEIGDLIGFRLDEYPRLVEANRHYAKMEDEILRRAPGRLPGYFELEQEKV